MVFGLVRGLSRHGDGPRRRCRRVVRPRDARRRLELLGRALPLGGSRQRHAVGPEQRLGLPPREGGSIALPLGTLPSLVAAWKLPVSLRSAAVGIRRAAARRSGEPFGLAPSGHMSPPWRGLGPLISTYHRLRTRGYDIPPPMRGLLIWWCAISVPQQVLGSCRMSEPCAGDGRLVRVGAWVTPGDALVPERGAQRATRRQADPARRCPYVVNALACFSLAGRAFCYQSHCPQINSPTLEPFGLVPSGHMSPPWRGLGPLISTHYGLRTRGYDIPPPCGGSQQDRKSVV